MRRRGLRGLTLLQTLFTLMIGGFIAATVFQMLATILISQQTAANLADASSVGRSAIDSIEDHLRNASGCGDDTKGVYGSVLDSANATSFAYYGESTNCTTVTYSLSGGNLVRTEGTTTKILVRNVTSVNFVYTVVDTSTNPDTTSTTSTPSATQLPLVNAVTITVVTNSGGISNTLTSSVRLRNLVNPDDGS